MNYLFNYRFYCLLNNSIKRRKFNSVLFAINSTDFNQQKRRSINTTKIDGKSNKNVKNKSIERQLVSKKFESKSDKNQTNIREFVSDSNDLLKTLDIDELAFRITVTEMKRFLANHNLRVSDGRTCLSIDCPFCVSKPNQLNSIDKSIDSKLFINKKTSNFICYSCQISGVWINLVELIASLKSGRKSSKLLLPKTNNYLFGDENTENQMKAVLEESQSIDDLSEEEFNSIINRFDLNFLTKESFKFYDLRVSKDLNQLIIPFKSCYERNKITALKTIELNRDNHESQSNRFVERLIPSDPKLSVFGLNQHLINGCSFEHLVITDSPLDAIAVTQQMNIPSISMPSKGISSHLPPEVLPFFERFKKITIWFSNSVQDLNCAKVFARKLDEKRCYLVGSRDHLTQHLSPLEALKRKTKLNKYLDSSQPISHSSITTFHTLRHAILSEMKDPLCSGVQWQRFPELNQLLKGHRSGELTVFTGPTGCGKTTFLSEYSLDLCSQGVRTLWGSFEVKNVRLAKMMLTQFAEKPISKHLDQFDLWADKFEELPLYFMTFHGQESIDNVLAAMSHAVYVHDIKHVIIDNMQFMLGCSDSFKFDRYWQQDLVLSKFRKFATREDCHISLVMHPRKEEDMDELNMNSIFGGAKASQEADNVLILQNKWLAVYKCNKYIQITKNRWDGDLGKVPLWFDKECLSYSPQNRRSTHTLNVATDENKSSIDSTKDMDFTRIKCNVEDFDDFRLQ